MKSPISQKRNLNPPDNLPQDTEKKTDSAHYICQEAALLACNYAIQSYGQGMADLGATSNKISTKAIDIMAKINRSPHNQKNRFKYLEIMDLLLSQFQELSVKFQSKE